MDAQTTFTTGDDLNPMELRILAWVCGDASPTEAAELERLTSLDPEWAAVRQQMQGVGNLLAEAAADDPEPLRLSPKRRARLLRNLMPRKNIMISFAIAVSLITAVAVYGDRTHYVAPLRIKPPADPTVYLVPPPADPDPVDQPDTKTDEKPADLPNPQQPDIAPVIADPLAITQPIEPPPTDGPTSTTQITSSDYGPRRPTAYALNQIDTPPAPRYQARADYPYSLRQQGVSGEVLVEFIVDPKGEVHNVAVVHSSHSGFEDSAVRAVSKWKFRPGRKGGVPVYVRMQVPIVFSIEGGD